MPLKSISFSSLQISKQSHTIKNCYIKNGILRIKNFICSETINNIYHDLGLIEKDALFDLKQNWDNQKLCFFSRNTQQTIIQNDFVCHPYFQASKNKAHVFYEQIDNKLAINRIGHGMHLNERYVAIQKLIYENQTLNNLLQIAGLKRPICHLSVYIPKYPHGIGSEIRPHQESTFAYTIPQSATVLWIAMEDVTIENACMWGILGSNHFPLSYVSWVDHQRKTREFKKLADRKLPAFSQQKNLFTPLAIKTGDALFFHGNFIHCSPNNLSNRSRKALSMQFIDTVNVDYPACNWITQPNHNYLYNLSNN